MSTDDRDPQVARLLLYSLQLEWRKETSLAPGSSQGLLKWQEPRNILPGQGKRQRQGRRSQSPVERLVAA